jgi:hypothetical protein
MGDSRGSLHLEGVVSDSTVKTTDTGSQKLGSPSAYWKARAKKAEDLLCDVQDALHVYEKVGNIKLPILEQVDSYFAEKEWSK